MPSLRPFERLVTRLVYRDAAQAYGAVVLAVAFAAVLVGRAWPPPQIREAVVAAAPATRAGLLAGALAAYLLATRPAMRLLLASARLAYLRHLPVARGRWRRLHLTHLVAVNLPWAAAAAYGLAGPAESDGLGPVARGVVGLAWVTLTLAAQVDAVYAARAGRRLVGLAAAVACAAAMILVAAPRPMTACAALVAAASLGRAWRALGAPPPERDGAVRRWFVRRRGGVRPVSALLRVHSRALVRRGPERLRRHLGVVAGCVGVASLAIAAAARVGQAPDPGLVRAMQITGALAGAHLSLAAVRLVDRDRWYLDALPIAPRVILRGRVVGGLVGASLGSLGVAAASAIIGDAAPLSAALEGVLVAAVAAAWTAWAGLRAEAQRRLHARALLGPAVAGLVALALLLSLRGGVGLALLGAEALVGLAAADAQVRPATQARRRLEMSRRDDDHAAG